LHASVEDASNFEINIHLPRKISDTLLGQIKEILDEKYEIGEGIIQIQDEFHYDWILKIYSQR
jgi:hypothetical protein